MEGAFAGGAGLREGERGPHVCCSRCHVCCSLVVHEPLAPGCVAWFTFTLNPLLLVSLARHPHSPSASLPVPRGPAFLQCPWPPRLPCPDALRRLPSRGPPRPASQVKWIDRGHERDEPLVSISTDGRVTQWSIAKGLEFVDLMKLKRIPRKPMEGPASAASNGATANGTAGKSAAAAAGEHDAFISRLTSGMSFDFSGRDERIYIAGATRPVGDAACDGMAQATCHVSAQVSRPIVIRRCQKIFSLSQIAISSGAASTP